MKKTVIILMSIILTLSVLGVLAGCGESGKSESDATVDETTKAEQVDVYVIETKYGDLKYPKKWQDKVTTKITDGDVYTVAFSETNGGTPLFDLNFGGGEGYLLGSFIDADKTEVVVNVDDKALDSKADNFDELCAMQEDVNVIMQNLIADYGFTPGVQNNAAAETEAETQVYEIKTSLATFFYPVKWKDKIKTEESGDSVAFYSDDIKVFELQLGGEEGFSVGKLNGKDLRLVTYEFEKDKLGQERFDELCAMQDDANVILEYLNEDSSFSKE